MREKPTKSSEISERLRQDILDGKFDDARKLPSEHQLMRRFAVARETVRAAIRDLLDKKLVERRHGYGTFLVDLAKKKAAQKFALIVPDAYYPFYGRICRGIRYRYGSGSQKTWDAFFYTDRDTNTNQVLDMYSNNIRYFNPDKPTASVADFDIEHMLPKSWWGGDVNPAYCDLYHRDYSANRSKSNHAPGIPADSTFNNGSFVTGSGEAYGLTRVFCPADEYKGDFARAYFYIATCYGDSLVWVASGEPGVAMTNSGWQEFRPWLRDLLVDWHRLDPVSEKEKTHAVEVNKIQGNRNPFIDYPELVEYIWGDKQGVQVDFRSLTQSYGDPYNDGTTTGLSEDTSRTNIRKIFKEGKLIIIRNQTIYTPLGQKLN